MNIGLVYREYAYDLVSRPGYTSGVSATAKTQSSPQWSNQASQPPDQQLDDKNIVNNSQLDLNSDHYVLGGEKFTLIEQTSCVQEIMVAEKIKEGRKNILSEHDIGVDKTNQKGEVAFNPQEIKESRDSLDYDTSDSWRIGVENFRKDTEAFNHTYLYQQDRMGANAATTTFTETNRPPIQGQVGDFRSTSTSTPVHLHRSTMEPVNSGREPETKLYVSPGVEFDVGTGNLPINFNGTKGKATELHMEELGRQVRLDQKIRSNEALDKIAEKGDDRFQERHATAATDQMSGRENQPSAPETTDPRPQLAQRTEAYKLAQNELRSYRELEYNTTPPDSALLINPAPPILGLGLEIVPVATSMRPTVATPRASAIGDYIHTKSVAATFTAESQRGSTSLSISREPAQSYQAEGPPVSMGLENSTTYNQILNPVPTITESNDVTRFDASPIYLSTEYGSMTFNLNPNDLEHRVSIKQTTPVTLNLQRLPMSNELDRDKVNLVAQSPTEQTVQVVRPENYYDHTSHFLKLTQAERVPEVPTDFVTNVKHITLRHNLEKHVDKARTEKITENQLYGRDDPRIQEVITLREIRQMDKFEKQIDYLEGQHTPPVEKTRGQVIPDRTREAMLSSLVWGWHYKQ